MLTLAAAIAAGGCGADPASSSPGTGVQRAAMTVRGPCDFRFTVTGSQSCTLNLWPAPVIPPAPPPPAATMVPVPACGYNVGGIFIPSWVPCPLCPPIAPTCTNFAPTNGVGDTCTCTSALAPPGGGFTNPSGVQTQIGNSGWWIDVGVSCTGFRDQVWTCPPPSTVVPPVAVVVNAPFGPGPQTANLTPSVTACETALEGAEGQIQEENWTTANTRCQQACPGGTLDSLGPDPATSPNPFYGVTPGGAGGCTASLSLSLTSAFHCHKP